MSKTVISWSDLPPNWLGEDRKAKEQQRAEEIRKIVRERVRKRMEQRGKSPAWKKEPNWGDTSTQG